MTDLVIAWVNGQDKIWQKQVDTFIQQNRIFENRYGTRFNDIGLFPYQLRLVSKFMPFIRKIHLLVSNIEQIYGLDLPLNTNVVLHKDFIPSKFLPTFNSCTIEMFLWNIPDLAEQFIYANDDMLPIKELKESDFFSPSGKIKINFKIDEINKCNNQFRQVCYSQYQMIKETTINDNYSHQFSKEHYYRPYHSFTPMIKSHCEQTYLKFQNEIDKQISPFRTNKNHNQYIYPLYELLCLKNTLESKIPFIYTEIKVDNNEVVQALKENAYKIICINDNRMSMLRTIDTRPIFDELERRLQ